MGLANTVTLGIVSARGRKQLPVRTLRYQDFIQTDAAINPGNSGGPLINARGEVIGVTSAVNRGAQGISFAIPVQMVSMVLEQLERHGEVRRSWLGAFVQRVSPALAQELELPNASGALLSKVVAGGPADQAGLKPGDIILRVGETPVQDADELSWHASMVGAGNTAEMTIVRGSDTLKINVTLAPMPCLLYTSDAADE